MKIVLVGGGTGGHFYPLIAVSEAIQDLCTERKLLEPELYYLGPTPFDERALLEHDIQYLPSAAGKMHRDRSIGNVFGMVATFFGIIRATFQLFGLYPDIIFSTGGYAAFPTLYAARLLKIPVAIYDADATPGRVSLWSAKFARWIAVAHPEAAVKFPERVRDRIAQTGHPIRKEIEAPTKEGGYEFLKLDQSAPVVFIMGGSQGAVAINEVILDALPDLVASCNVVHQTGTANLQEVSRVAAVILKDSRYQERYVSYGLLNTLALRMAAGVASVVVARAGSGTIFEVASWGLPSIMVPIPSDISHDQTENAFSYARAGGCVVIEQHNLTPHLLVAEIKRIIDDPQLRESMSQAARAFAKPQAARKIATVILDSALEHETG
ncbi:MAG: UDP-N-acetylglucosamine--N-acetylmuramyl-(pentapeptide) pyrophosphoryl-undecaprenol N-acetylglucosamine transferase [Candidatus Pacebacteria bacterium]|nr:UDP-N-acetylglucosamine--N-acetylmuramyl-(pentapeptide) pyrophosphoryl-undecaprenol N-acetylglucosamine transferase [Candidatus Paceibacterota bacterium]